MANKVNKNFLKESYFIINLKLCSVRLINNNKFPWIILIPRRKNITDITELNSKDQFLLMKEIVDCSKLMKKIFKTKKLNVEKIGNIVPQLHIHVIARSVKDSSWPLSVWVVTGKPYSKALLDKTITKIKDFFSI
jgi:diadenosine tetraphosphate (Ap4A) HIT family hydrolase|tara:strand:- start:102 stop:506 length:405 start_codon:yes stop_codon:yes gene_type:complete